MNDNKPNDYWPMFIDGLRPPTKEELAAVLSASDVLRPLPNKAMEGFTIAKAIRENTDVKI